jgi:hypothetical protein
MPKIEPKPEMHVASVESAEAFAIVGGLATFSVLTPLPLDHPFYVQIGRVAAEWAKLEHFLDLIIWELSGGSNELLSCITGQLLGQFGRFNAIQSLAAAKGYDGKMLKRIEHLSNCTAGLAKRRNRFVHDAWYIKHRDSETKVGQFKSRSAKDNKFGFDEVTSTYAEETITQIKSAFSAIGVLRSDLSNGPTSSSPKTLP